jgi:hypothetical protein
VWSFLIRIALQATSLYAGSWMQVFIGKGYVNNARSHDVVFIVESKPFYAHKIALTASSEAFHAMFESDCMEGSGGVPTIDIPNISHQVFEAMVMFLYTGDISNTPEAAVLPELLEAADQYLIDDLTAACASTISRRLTVSTVVEQFELAMRYNAKQLAHAAVAYIVAHYDDVEQALGRGRHGLACLLAQVRPVLSEYLQCYLWCDASPRDGDNSSKRTIASQA